MIFRLAVAVLALTGLAWTSHSSGPTSQTDAPALEKAPFFAQSAGEASDVTFARLTGRTLAQASNNDSKPRGSRCSANGAPDCGGSCSIECDPGKRARCVSGSCNPNSAYVCACERHTYCGCE